MVSLTTLYWEKIKYYRDLNSQLNHKISGYKYVVTEYIICFHSLNHEQISVGMGLVWDYLPVLMHDPASGN